MSGRCLEGVRKVYGKSLEGVWKMSGRCLEGVWTVSGMCLESIWKMSGRCLEGVWKVSGGSLKRSIFIDYQKSYFKSKFRFSKKSKIFKLKMLHLDTIVSLAGITIQGCVLALLKHCF